MKIGVYVGSFNPVHYGHMHIVKRLLEENIVDHIEVIATGAYWEKRELLPLEERIFLLKYYEGDRIHIDTEHNLFPYTYEIMDALSKEHPEDTLCLVIGADQLADFSKWKRVEHLLEFPIIVIPRDGINVKSLLKRFPRKAQVTVADEIEEIEISSTKIRSLLHSKEDAATLKKYLHPKVLDYLKENKSYER